MQTLHPWTPFCLYYQKCTPIDKYNSLNERLEQITEAHGFMHTWDHYTRTDVIWIRSRPYSCGCPPPVLSDLCSLPLALFLLVATVVGAFVHVGTHIWPAMSVFFSYLLEIIQSFFNMLSVSNKILLLYRSE